jgi:hypothetical protein
MQPTTRTVWSSCSPQTQLRGTQQPPLPTAVASYAMFGFVLLMGGEGVGSSAQGGRVGGLLHMGISYFCYLAAAAAAAAAAAPLLLQAVPRLLHCSTKMLRSPQPTCPLQL